MRSKGLRYRWFTENCHEIQLPSGEVLLVDPMLPTENDTHWKGFYSGYTVEDLERVDYVFITHTHGDHIAQLKAVMDKFNPVMLVNQSTMVTLSKALDLPIRKIVPFSDFQTYDFGTFKITPYPGVHVPTIGDVPVSEFYKMVGNLTADDPNNKDLLETNVFGSCFNSNFMLEVPGGTRIAFIQGQYTALTKQNFMNSNPTLVIRQLSLISRFPEVFDQLVERMDDTKTALMAFMCHHHPTKDPQKTSREINEIMEKKDGLSRLFVPEKGRWITLHTTIDFE